MPVEDKLADKPESVVRAEQVAELFAEVFDEESVGIDDDFFRLGGDSFSGVALMTAIEQRFGLVLSFSVLMEASTPRDLARAIFEANASRIARCLTSIRPDGPPPAIFYVHGNVGESVAPKTLSTALGSHAFYAFRAVGLEPGEEFLTSVDAIATTYLSGIAQVHRGGPMVLLGHCGGTMIVYEMAQQLAAAGKRPAGLIMADPEISTDFAPYLHHSGLALSLMHSAWAKRAAWFDEARDANPNPTGEMRRAMVTRGIQHAIGTYIPKPYDGPTLLLVTPERKDLLLQKGRGIPALVNDLEIVELRTDHGGMFKDSGLVQVAEAIDRFVARL